MTKAELLAELENDIGDSGNILSFHVQIARSESEQEDGLGNSKIVIGIMTGEKERLTYAVGSILESFCSVLNVSISKYGRAVIRVAGEVRDSILKMNEKSNAE